MSSSAANKVFTIPELLELVLMNMAQFDLFVVQRVSRAFCSTIHNSPSLEQTLYAAAPYSQDPDASARLMTVPQIQSTFHPTTMAHMQPEEVYGSYSRLLHHLNLGPFIRRAWIHHETKKVPVLAFFLYLDREHEEVGWQGMSAVHSQGSWRKMPLEMTKGESHVLVRSWKGPESRTLPPGATFGDLVEALHGFREKPKEIGDSEAIEERVSFSKFWW